MAKKEKSASVKMRAPHKRVSGLSVDGSEYKVEKGVVEVDAEHESAAVEHGFVRLDEPDAPSE